jgi:hypothetical protein
LWLVQGMNTPHLKDNKVLTLVKIEYFIVLCLKENTHLLLWMAAHQNQFHHSDRWKMESLGVM